MSVTIKPNQLALFLLQCASSPSPACSLASWSEYPEPGQKVYQKQGQRLYGYVERVAKSVVHRYGRRPDYCQLHGRCREVVLVPEEFVVFDDAADDVKEGLVAQSAGDGVDPCPVDELAHSFLRNPLLDCSGRSSPTHDLRVNHLLVLLLFFFRPIPLLLTLICPLPRDFGGIVGIRTL